jgi:predicted NAD/FAD-dependent oxidoreductase
MGDEIQRWPSQKAEPKPIPDRTSWAIQASADYWREAAADPMGKLRLLDARFARLDPNGLDFFKAEVADAIRAADPKAVLGDPHLVGLIRALWGERGVVKLRDRAKQ